MTTRPIDRDTVENAPDRAPPTNDAASPESEADLASAHVRVVRAGHGANCSSVGSVVDALFLGAVVGSAILAAVTAALREEASSSTPGASGTGGDDSSAGDAPPSGTKATGA